MIEWFIVAFISMPNTDKLRVELMQNPFATRPACVQYLTDHPDIINDIQKIAPKNTGMRFQCLDTNQVIAFKKRGLEI